MLTLPHHRALRQFIARHPRQPRKANPGPTLRQRFAAALAAFADPRRHSGMECRNPDCKDAQSGKKTWWLDFGEDFTPVTPTIDGQAAYAGMPQPVYLAPKAGSTIQLPHGTSIDPRGPFAILGITGNATNGYDAQITDGGAIFVVPLFDLSFYSRGQQ